MKISNTIYNGFLIISVVFLIYACATSPPDSEEVPEAARTQVVDSRGYDPLEFAQDREVVPRRTPRSGSVVGRGTLIESDSRDSETDTSEVAIELPRSTIDSANNQVFRVQVFTSELYGEARKAVRVAEEIFDQPVYVDYEVPYFKVRVGDFGDRDQAENYQQMAKAAGYRNAWVVVVKIGLKQVAPLYDDLPVISIPRTEEPDSVAEDYDEN